jgi:hypothetical protein
VVVHVVNILEGCVTSDEDVGVEDVGTPKLESLVTLLETGDIVFVLVEEPKGLLLDEPKLGAGLASKLAWLPVVSPDPPDVDMITGIWLPVEATCPLEEGDEERVELSLDVLLIVWSTESWVESVGAVLIEGVLELAWLCEDTGKVNVGLTAAVRATRWTQAGPATAPMTTDLHVLGATTAKLA